MVDWSINIAVAFAVSCLGLCRVCARMTDITGLRPGDGARDPQRSVFYNTGNTLDNVKLVIVYYSM